MRVIETKVYTFAELGERAKERARDWWREAMGHDTDWAEWPVENFGEVLKACGYDVDKPRGQRTGAAIYWELNPDGAGFVASWSASRVNVAAIIADRPVTFERDGKRETCEHNGRLVPLLQRMAALAEANPDSYGSVSVNRGPHISETEWHREDCRDLECTCDDAGNEFDSLSRELAQFLAWSLSKEWEFQGSAECIDDMLECNEYEFTADGERA